MLTTRKHIIPNVSYYRLEAHELLLKDIVRVNGFKNALNKIVSTGDIVLDFGTGSGILAFLACQAGAGHVYAVEKEQMINIAIRIAELNGYRDKIDFIEDDANNINLPNQVDVLVSEVIGSFGLNTMSIDTLLKLRKKFLKPTGSIIPESMALFISPFASESILSEMTFWKTPRYGIDFSPLNDFMSNQVYMVLLEDHKILASPESVHHVNFLLDDTVPKCSCQKDFTIHSPGNMVGLCGWYDVKLAAEVTFSTNPAAPVTSWYQTMFPLYSPIEVFPNDQLSIKLSNEYCPPLVEWRWEIVINRNGKNILSESHASREGFPRSPSGMPTSYYVYF